jgi:hypothetical protein
MAEPSEILYENQRRGPRARVGQNFSRLIVLDRKEKRMRYRHMGLLVALVLSQLSIATDGLAQGSDPRIIEAAKDEYRGYFGK